MKISEYPQVATYQQNDVVVISGVAGDRQIGINTLASRYPRVTPPSTTITLTAAGWDSNNTQTINLPSSFRMTIDTIFMWDLSFGATTDQYQRFTIAGIRDIGQGLNSVRFKAYFFKPDVPINLVLWNLS